ncbi:MAG: hypothetical protein KGL39_34035 [Patescibacteria group bacterium]|nr:hypothetical protein [Patescibacteria group bacterium]
MKKTFTPSHLANLAAALSLKARQRRQGLMARLAVVPPKGARLIPLTNQAHPQPVAAVVERNQRKQNE